MVFLLQENLVSEPLCHHEFLSGHRKKCKKHQEASDTNRFVTRAFAAMNMNSIVSISDTLAPKMFSLEPCKPVVARKMNGN